MKVISHPLPFFDERTCPIDMLVIHAVGMRDVQTSIQTFCHYRVSAHYLVGRDGRIYQFVDESKRAWHAGISCWNGLSEDLNSHSVGIEFQTTFKNDQFGSFTQKQMAAGIRLAREIVRRYRINPDNVVRHSDIAPGRKTDPGEHFPWDRFKREIFL